MYISILQSSILDTHSLILADQLAIIRELFPYQILPCGLLACYRRKAAFSMLKWNLVVPLLYLRRPLIPHMLELVYVAFLYT